MKGNHSPYQFLYNGWLPEAVGSAVLESETRLPALKMVEWLGEEEIRVKFTFPAEDDHFAGKIIE